MSIDTQHLSGISSEAENEQILPKGAILKNRYEVLKILGLGGMGYVYLSRDLNFAKIKRLCAIKEMVSTTTDPAFRKLSLANFEREANTLASINHPNIIKIYDYFTEGNRTYLVMEYVDGEDLEHVVNNVPDDEFLKEERVLKWGIEICDILNFLHTSETPIVYRDLKPPNLMLRSNKSDRLALIDFGIAKAFQEGQKGTMMGTEGYSPPEQYRGIASPQGDVYALGATLHHMLTRRDPKLEPPFSFHEALPRQINPAISEKTEQVIMKSLTYDMQARYSSAQEMKVALEDALAGLTQPSRPSGQLTGQPGTQPHISYPAGAAANMQQTAPPTNFLDTSAQATVGGMKAPDLMESINQELDSGIIPVWTFKAEDEIRSSPVLANGIVYFGVYDNNLYALDAKTGKFLWKYPTDGGIPTKPCFHKDKIIFGSEDRLVYAVTSNRGKILWTCPTGGRVRGSVNVEFEHAFFGSDDGFLYAANAQSGRIIWKFEAGGPIRSTPAIDNEIVYVGCEDGHLYAVDMQTGKMKWKSRTNRAATSSPAIYEDLVVIGSQDWTLYAFNKTSGWSIWHTRTNQAIISSPVIKDDIIYFGSADGNFYALDAPTGKNVWKYKAGSHIVSTPAISNDSIYFGTSSGEVISIFIKNGTEKWRFQTGGPVPSSPVLGEGVVYIGSTDHNLYALPT